MQSNSRYTIVFKHIFIFLSIISFGVGFIGYFIKDSITINGKPTSLNFYDLLIAIAIGFFMIILWLYFKNKVIAVRLGGQKLILYKGKEEEHFDWTNVESVSQLMLVYPPLYKLRIKNRSGYYLFVTQPFSINSGLGALDLSDMESLIKKKKIELDI